MMAPHINAIRAMIMNCILLAIQTGSSVHFALIKFRSIQDSWITRVHQFTDDIHIFRQWFDNDEPGGNCLDGFGAVGDALHTALQMQWPNHVEEFEEKIVTLFTSDAPNGLSTELVGADLWVTSNELREENKTLAVVGAGSCAMAFDDFYCALAENTGGIFIPVVNFEKIFSNVITMMSDECDTASHAFRRISLDEIEQNSSFRYKDISERVKAMIRECQTMADIRHKFYNYRSSQSD